MRLPTPAALLVDHPAVPVPVVRGASVEISMAGDPVAMASLSRRDRFRLAVQLTAAASILAEFDLWPGRAAVRRARAVRTEDGLQAILPRFPVSLSRVSARLGGGEAAAETTRTAVLLGIAEAVGLPEEMIGAGRDEPGFFLEAAVSRQLRELPRPLDLATARNLWAIRWDLPPFPEEGEASYWSVPILDLAQRFAAALWSGIRRRRRPAWSWLAGIEGGDTAPVPVLGGPVAMIVAGTLRQKDLASVARWTQREGCSAAAFGTFPDGWHPPVPPGFDAEHLARHLAVAGVSIERARQLVEQRQGRFNPFDLADRQALTESARTVFETTRKKAGRPTVASDREPFARILALATDGLPEGFVALQSGLSPAELERRRAALPVVESDGRWRLAEISPLALDPLHTEVAGLFDREDPRHLLHLALGSGDSSDLEAWARGRLDDLAGFEVRNLLAGIAPGALGDEVQLLHAEACLSILDPAGARSALAGVPARKGGALTRWLESVDHAFDTRRLLPTRQEECSSPRAAAEAALWVLRGARRGQPEAASAALGVIGRSMEALAGPVRRWIELELSAVEAEERLAERAWRRELVGGHPVLDAQLRFRRALQLFRQGRKRPARWLLEALAKKEQSPGRKGVLELELGVLALDEGRSRDADAHHLRGYRLLQAAGFHHLIRLPLFNLAVADLDLLRVDRAAKRLEMLSEGVDDPWVAGELARLALATGQETLFRERLAAFETGISENDPRFATGLELLRGAAALLDSDLEQACEHLQRADQEGKTWLALATAAMGRPVGPLNSDGWGVGSAAELVRGMRDGGGDLASMISDSPPQVDLALAMALAERVGGRRLPLDTQSRGRAVRILRERGLFGWAKGLAGTQDDLSGAVGALAGMVEAGGPAGISGDLEDQLLRHLGLEGLELRDQSDGRLVWRCGEGSPGPEVRHGPLRVVPLGGDVPEGPTWRLLLGLLELFVPPSFAGGTDPEVGETGFQGISEGARTVQRQISEFGPSHVPILLVGETGVGKEVAARGLHQVSGRKGSLVAFNVAAIPANLLEAELFGSVKGAFTGADRSRRGLVAAADGGTLFLDEIGDLDPPLQVKLLRFLESQEVRPVGADQPTKVDVRIVSATHRDLQKRIREGAFRQDLYFRVASLPIVIPPLRERREDILLLRTVFEKEAAAHHGLRPSRWSREAEDALLRYHWPGNVRELRQAVDVALISAAGTTVLAEHLPIAVPHHDLPSGTWNEATKDFRRRFLVAALRRNGGNRSATARELGISRQALLYHIRTLGLAGLE